jgi:hypothetical protein
VDWLQGEKMEQFVTGNAQQSVPFRTELAYGHLRLKNKETALKTIRQNIVDLESNVRVTVMQIFPLVTEAEIRANEGVANEISYLISNYFLAGRSSSNSKPS